MKIQTMSVVVGNQACNAKCPFCISAMTGYGHVDVKWQDRDAEWNSFKEINWRNFEKCCELAKMSGVTTILLTGKGEPTLHPTLITKYLEELEPYKFPFIELQTNGIAISKGLKTNRLIQLPCQNLYELDALETWYGKGLTTICLSVVHPLGNRNHEIYQPELTNGYMDVAKTIKEIHDKKLMVRLSCMLLNGYIDSVTKLEGLIGFCRTNNVKQLTVRPIDSPANVDNERVKWVSEHTLSSFIVDEMQAYLKKEGTPILELAHGGVVYDVDGQNVCWATCMTTNKTTDDMRQIIFFPDGTVSHDWKYKGAILLG